MPNVWKTEFTHNQTNKQTNKNITKQNKTKTRTKTKTKQKPKQNKTKFIRKTFCSINVQRTITPIFLHDFEIPLKSILVTLYCLIRLCTLLILWYLQAVVELPPESMVASHQLVHIKGWRRYSFFHVFKTILIVSLRRNKMLTWLIFHLFGNLSDNNWR